MTKGNSNMVSLLLFVSTFLILQCCAEDHEILFGICDVATEFTVDEDIGRVYYYDNPDDPDKHFYYIGNPDEDLRGWGGVVPCNGIPDNFLHDGETH